MNKNAIIHKNKNAAQSFVEEFASSILDPAWSVFEWKGPNIYDCANFGRYSLTDHPGHLRYYLGSIMGPAYLHAYRPSFSGWYWSYPSLEISRPLYDDHWVLEAKVTHSLVDGANGRGYDLIVFFDPARDREMALRVTRAKDMRPTGNRLGVQLYDHGTVIATIENCHSPHDTLGVTQFTYTYRISRADTLVQVEISDDGTNFRQVFSHTLRSALRGQPQLLALTGGGWFVPAGAYADWDYVRFRNVDLGLRKE